MALDQIEIINILRSELADNFVSESKISPNNPVAHVAKSALLDAVKLLVERSEARFCMLTSVDNGLDFELIYHFSIGGRILSLKTTVPKELSELPSITDVVPGAASAEREVCDLFKINFQGLSDSRPLIVPYEWRDKKAPLRKPMGGIVAQYQKPTVETMMQHGQVFTMPSSVKANRENLQLPEVKTTMTRPEALRELQEIAREVKFDSLIGYDWQKRRLRY
ncbi:NADH-quinone oxidoreductase subunit C [Candidatus Bathyarchaeota archaeon]|nr:NADH-quinone oxidoreductase subunit C [Candidatus Bathyarchaeota archaeon]